MEGLRAPKRKSDQPRKVGGETVLGKPLAERWPSGLGGHHKFIHLWTRGVGRWYLELRSPSCSVHSVVLPFQGGRFINFDDDRYLESWFFWWELSPDFDVMSLRQDLDVQMKTWKDKVRYLNV